MEREQNSQQEGFSFYNTIFTFLETELFEDDDDIELPAPEIANLKTIAKILEQKRGAKSLLKEVCS